MPRRRPEEVAEEFRQVTGAIIRRMRAASGDQGPGYAEVSVLKRLDGAGAATTADLARAELVTPQSMGALVAALEESGFVSRTPDPNDGRRRVVSITAKGASAMRVGRAARQSWLAREIDDKLDADEQRTVLAAIALLRRIVPS